MTSNFLEKLARSYVKNCADVATTMRECAPAIAEKTDKALVKHFEQTYNDVPQFWEFVEEYRAEVKKEIALSAADLMMAWTQNAALDCTEFTKVVLTPCPRCWVEGPRMPLPNLSCTICGGQGMKQVEVTPTAQLSPLAKSLYRGAEQTKHGIKVTYADPEKAKDNLARALGMFTANLQIAAVIKPAMPDLPTDQNEASKIYAEWIKGG